MNGADKIQMAELEAMKKSALAPHETRLATCRGHAGVIWIANQGWKMVESKQVIGRKRQSRPQFPGAWHGYTSSAAQSRSLQWNSPSDGEAGLKAERLALQEREKERQPSPTTTGRHQAIRDKASMQTPGATVALTGAALRQDPIIMAVTRSRRYEPAFCGGPCRQYVAGLRRLKLSLVEQAARQALSSTGSPRSHTKDRGCESSHVSIWRKPRGRQVSRAVTLTSSRRLAPSLTSSFIRVCDKQDQAQGTQVFKARV